MSEDLKPCPFCNQSEVAMKPGWRNSWRVICKNLECQTEGPERESNKSAVQAWNTANTQQHHPQPLDDSEGWVDWKRGECPVASNAYVEVRRVDGHFARGRAAKFVWRTGILSESIVAYRVIENDGREG